MPVSSASSVGVLMLVGDILPLKNQIVWRNLVNIANRKDGENVVIAAAHKRPELYGGFTLRAYQRYGDSAELLPLAEIFQEFSTDYKFTVKDQALNDRIRGSKSVFFVGGAPQRLSKILIDKKGVITDMGSAIQEAHRSGSLIVGGIPGHMGAATTVDAMHVLASGQIEPEELYQGLALIDRDWYVDQHFFGGGRFAAALVAMHQLDMKFGVGVGLDTAAVIYMGNMEVLGNRGVVTVDLSDASLDETPNGVIIRRVRLNYLENGDRLNMDTMQTIPFSKKASDFELLPKNDAIENPPNDPFVSSQNLFAPGELVRLMYESLDAGSGQSQGYVYHRETRSGFHFRFYTGADSKGWLTPRTGEDQFTLTNIYLDVSPTGGGS